VDIEVDVRVQVTAVAALVESGAVKRRVNKQRPPGQPAENIRECADSIRSWKRLDIGPLLASLSDTNPSSTTSGNGWAELNSAASSSTRPAHDPSMFSKLIACSLGP
jgi:hypothetical protein